MSGVAKKLMGTTAAGGELLAIEDVFSTYLYTGISPPQTITNGIDLAGEGGLVWTKTRSAVRNHHLTDTEIGSDNVLSTNLDNGVSNFGSIGFTSFNSDGFTVGSSSVANSLSDTIASWTFRKAPRFFDVVTWTGDGNSGRQISHSLGSTVGSIFIKSTTNATNWIVHHRSLGESQALNLNFSAAAFSFSGGITNVTDSSFTLSSNGSINGFGETYVAYLFAHDPLGPSGDGSDGLIACGSYTGNGSPNGPVINLGWEPQWLLIKGVSDSGLWELYDSMRGLTVAGVNDARLIPNDSGAEGFGSLLEPRSTGFQITNNGADRNASGQTYIYIAIRRGPMRAPTSGTEVFSSVARTTTGATYTYTGNAFPVDMVMQRQRAVSNTVDQANIFDRLRGATKYLSTAQTQAEQTISGITNFDRQDGYVAGFGSWSAMNWTSGSTEVYYNFRRAPNVFDVVAYSGNSVAGRTVPHNLGVAPELMIAKTRDAANYWVTYDAASGPTKFMILHQNNGTQTSIDHWNNTAPTASVFTVGDGNYTNRNATQHIIYLFATLPGVSKVGSYTGNGTSQTIDCGFTTGARFILIKRTDSTGDWYIWDTARGIVTGNDPHLSLNTTAAEVTTDDSIDPDSSGFIVNQVAATNINVSAASYIFYAVA
jgi:hypothetical protein